MLVATAIATFIHTHTYFGHYIIFSYQYQYQDEISTLRNCNELSAWPFYTHTKVVKLVKIF